MKKILLFLFSTLVVGVFGANAQGVIDVIKKNYSEMLLFSELHDDAPYVRKLNLLPPDDELSDRCIVELYQRRTVTKEAIDKILSTLKEDGSWSDINYQDKTRSGWKVKEHVERIFPMCRYYRLLLSQNKKDEAAGLFKQIDNSLQWWVDHNPISPNWWHNQVGVPKTLGSALLLVWDELSEQLQNKIIKVVFDQHVKFGMTGQNKVWKAGNMLIRALLTNDEALLKEARNTIASEIRKGEDEGIQPDWSFHQHGPQQQLGNYGLAYISTMSFYDELFQNSELKFSTEQRDILLNFINKGYGWTLWNGRLDVNCLNRQLFKNVATNKYEILQLCSRSMMGKDMSLHFGNHHFQSSDMTVHRMKKWMASVKMASNRIIGTEQLNGDNQQGYYTADGATYVYTSGDEYDNIFPLWDWRKIPGITCYQSEKPVPDEKARLNKRNRTNFVGAVSNNSEGVTAMELNRNGLKAKKMWAFTDKYMVCLGTDIKTDSLPVATTIEQCNTTENSKWVECAPKRFLMKDKGYIILDDNQPVMSVESRTGDWNKIMRTYKPCQRTGYIATMYINHGMTHNGSYQYMILPNATAKSLKKFKTEAIEVHANNANLQLLQIGNTVFAVVYQSNTNYTTAKGEVFKFAQKGLYLGKKSKNEWQFEYSDPTIQK